MILPYVRFPEPTRIAYVDRRGYFSGDRTPDVVYVAHARARELLTAGEAEATCWNGDPIRLDYRGRTCVILAGVEGTDAAMLDGLMTWRDWLASHRARAASVGSSAWSLLRATITEGIWTAAGQPPPLLGTLGGRQHLAKPSGTYSTLLHHDLQASYPRVLADVYYGGAWSFDVGASERQVRDAVTSRTPCFVRAEVRSDLVPGPLPRRPRGRPDPWRSLVVPVTYPVGRFRGFWSGAEVVAAIDAGAKVKLGGAWLHGAGRRPFERWWAAVAEGRELSGLAGVLAKITGNAMWGQLAITDGIRERLSFRGDRRHVTPAPLRGGGRPRAHDLAEHVTGTVRAKLYAELIAPAGSALVVAHTDGGWTHADFTPTGTGWRLKDVAEVLDVVNPQALCYRDGAGKVVYKMAGVTASEAPEAFAEVWRAQMGRKDRAVI